MGLTFCIRFALCSVMFVVSNITIAAPLSHSEITEKIKSVNAPEMGTLFFSTEQRRALEALRQNIITNDDIVEFANFTPVILTQEIVLEEIKVVKKVRVMPLGLDSLIRNNKTGETTYWLNGEKIRSGEINALTHPIGIYITSPNLGIVGLLGDDRINKIRFDVRPGQVLDINGDVTETLPVVSRSDT